MQTKTKESRKKEKYFWTAEYIQEHAVNYCPWYKGIRSLPYFWSALGLIAFFVWSFYVGDLLGAIGYLSGLLLGVLPLWIFAARGYRWPLYIGCGSLILMTINNIIHGVSGNVFLSLFFVMIFISSIRIENYRIKHHLVQKHTVLKDCLIALCPIILFFLFCVPVRKLISTIYERATAFYGEVKPYEIYCSNQGYQMKFYPVEFYKKFDKELNELDNRLHIFGTSLENVWQGIERNAELLSMAEQKIDKSMKEYQRSIALGLLSKKNSVPIDSIQWQPSYENLVTIQDVCRIIDENAAEIVKGMQRPY